MNERSMVLQIWQFTFVKKNIFKTFLLIILKCVSEELHD